MSGSVESVLSQLEDEYDLEAGFLGLLRSGQYDSKAAERLLDLLRGLDLGAESVIDRRLVSLLWYMPLFIEWQQRRFSGEEAVAVESMLNKVTTQLERILGVP